MPNLRSKTWTTTTPAAVEDAQFWEDHLISDLDAGKIQSAVQTVNGTSPDASGNVDVVALPSGGTAGQVLTKQSSTSGDADWEDPASSGHTIKDEDGNGMPYQSVLQFLSADVSNDNSNHKTVVDCKGAKGDPGQAATITVGTTTTLAPGSDATVSNSGTTSAAVFNFGIPKGADGVDGTDGDDGRGISSVTLISTSGKVKTYRMTFTDNTYFDYSVTDGADGTGAGDMLAADYDANQAVYNAGGIAAYVSSQAYSLPTAAANTLGGVKVGTNLSIDANGVLSATDTTYSDATTSASGLMSSTDKSKLNGIASGAEVNVQSDWNQSNSSADDFIKNKPTIPAAANDATITIQKNSTAIDSFTTNASVAKNINIPMDEWTSTSQVQSDNTVTFTGLNDDYGYDLYCADKVIGISSVAKTGSGTSVQLVYTVTGAAQGDYCKLRILK